MKKAALHNLGCKVNAYETEAMQQMLEEAGYEIVPFSEKADVYVINTCSVTNMADRKSRQMLHRAKKRNPDAAVVAAGCYVQTKEDEAKCDEAIDKVFLDHMPFVPTAYDKLVKSIRGILPHNMPQNRFPANLNHRLWTHPGFFADAGALAPC